MAAIERIIYVGDPMCSWCWGFAPQLAKLRELLEGNVAFSLLPGGLRDGHAWDAAFKTFLQAHWQEVHARTGQPFSMELLEREHFDYTTEPACRAVCCAREFSDAEAFALFEALQRAFYEQGKDITSDETIITIAEHAGLDKKRFTEMFYSDALRKRVEHDRHKAKAYGATAFPSLVIIDEEGHLSTLRGYRDFKEIKKLLRL